MSYININEVDKTLFNTTPITNDNIVYVPGNSSDGPSGEYVLLGSYNDLVSIFGSDPNPNATRGSSWDYAANLLMQGFPVMFRRITHYVDADGYDITEVQTSGENAGKSGPLPGVSTAQGIINLTQKGKADTIEDKPIAGETDPDPFTEKYANLFVINYRFPGTAGNRITARVNYITDRAVYLRAYRGTGIIENIELVNLTTTNPATGSITSMGTVTEEDKVAIWKKLVKRFGTTVGPDGDVTSVKEIESDYITLRFNDNIPMEIFKDDFDKDDTLKSYAIVFVDALLSTLPTEIFTMSGGSNPGEACVLNEVSKTYRPLKDKYRYDIKFVTNGGYVDQSSPNDDGLKRPIESEMIGLAQDRGDCIAIPDMEFDAEAPNVKDYFAHLSTSYAAAYAPWAKMNLSTRSNKWMPPSFIFLYTLAKAVKNGGVVYDPPAGIRRASVPEITQLKFPVNSSYLVDWQESTPQSVNPIIDINQYGYVIFGQKTLYSMVSGSGLTKSSLQDLNVRLVANEIKKTMFRASLELTFEKNNIHTWNEFKAKVTPLLDTMKANRSINYYEIVMDTSTMTAEDIDNNRIVGKVSVAVARAAENFDLTFELLPNQIEYLYETGDDNSLETEIF